MVERPAPRLCSGAAPIEAHTRACAGRRGHRPSYALCLPRGEGQRRESDEGSSLYPQWLYFDPDHDREVPSGLFGHRQRPLPWTRRSVVANRRRGRFPDQPSRWPLTRTASHLRTGGRSGGACCRLQRTYLGHPLCHRRGHWAVDLRGPWIGCALRCFGGGRRSLVLGCAAHVSNSYGQPPRST
jgi:hypothetical protein